MSRRLLVLGWLAGRFQRAEVVTRSKGMGPAGLKVKKVRVSPLWEGNHKVAGSQCLCLFKKSLYEK